MHSISWSTSGEAIYQSYSDILGDFEINHNVLSVITDSASNMIKAFKLPNYTDGEGDDDDECVDSEYAASEYQW